MSFLVRSNGTQVFVLTLAHDASYPKTAQTLTYYMNLVLSSGTMADLYLDISTVQYSSVRVTSVGQQQGTFLRTNERFFLDFGRPQQSATLTFPFQNQTLVFVSARQDLQHMSAAVMTDTPYFILNTSQNGYLSYDSNQKTVTISSTTGSLFKLNTVPSTLCRPTSAAAFTCLPLNISANTTYAKQTITDSEGECSTTRCCFSDTPPPIDNNTTKLSAGAIIAIVFATVCIGGGLFVLNKKKDVIKKSKSFQAVVDTIDDVKDIVDGFVTDIKSSAGDWFIKLNDMMKSNENITEETKEEQFDKLTESFVQSYLNTALSDFKQACNRHCIVKEQTAFWAGLWTGGGSTMPFLNDPSGDDELKNKTFDIQALHKMLNINTSIKDPKKKIMDLYPTSNNTHTNDHAELCKNCIGVNITYFELCREILKHGGNVTCQYETDNKKEIVKLDHKVTFPQDDTKKKELLKTLVDQHFKKVSDKKFQAIQENMLDNSFLQHLADQVSAEHKREQTLKTAAVVGGTVLMTGFLLYAAAKWCSNPNNQTMTAGPQDGAEVRSDADQNMETAWNFKESFFSWYYGDPTKDNQPEPGNIPQSNGNGGIRAYILSLFQKDSTDPTESMCEESGYHSVGNQCVLIKDNHSIKKLTKIKLHDLSQKLGSGTNQANVLGETAEKALNYLYMGGTSYDVGKVMEDYGQHGPYNLNGFIDMTNKFADANDRQSAERVVQQMTLVPNT